MPIISQVWDLLETLDDQLVQSDPRLRQSSSDGLSSPTDVEGGGRRLSLKKLFQLRSSKMASRRGQPAEQLSAKTSAEESQNSQNDDTSLLTNYIIAGIPSTEIDLANYVVAHGILSKQLR